MTTLLNGDQIDTGWGDPERRELEACLATFGFFHHVHRRKETERLLRGGFRAAHFLALQRECAEHAHDWRKLLGYWINRAADDARRRAEQVLTKAAEGCA